MRGEDHLPTRKDFSTSRSPPHARGRPTTLFCRLSGGRITPACAGKTRSGRTLSRQRTDHPRMRGEDVRLPAWPHPVWASPPHARGRHVWPSHDGYIPGITPACAGKTRSRGSSRACRRDHPRMRGEDSRPATVSARKSGSPPHARGRRLGARAAQLQCRITPACAGKTKADMRGGEDLEDHPRMRGEDLPVDDRRDGRWGSPPHARGRLYSEYWNSPWAGITPACAGKTLAALKFWALTPGSPPHARGRRGVDGCLDDASRITPACAGKTWPRGRSQRPPWDHPRMRGEDKERVRHHVSLRGSPPQARGRPKHHVKPKVVQ